MRGTRTIIAGIVCHQVNYDSAPGAAQALGWVQCLLKINPPIWRSEISPWLSTHKKGPSAKPGPVATEYTNGRRCGLPSPRHLTTETPADAVTVADRPRAR